MRRSRAEQAGTSRDKEVLRPAKRERGLGGTGTGGGQSGQQRGSGTQGGAARCPRTRLGVRGRRGHRIKRPRRTRAGVQVTRSRPPVSVRPPTLRRPGLRRLPNSRPSRGKRRQTPPRPPAGRPLTRMPCSTRTRSSWSIPRDALRPSRLSVMPMAGGGSGAPVFTGPAPPANKAASYWPKLEAQPIAARAARHCGGCSLAVAAHWTRSTRRSAQTARGQMAGRGA